MTAKEGYVYEVCSPRAWGWSGRAGGEVAQLGVFPTGVGMVRRWLRRSPAGRSVPHGRGDGPRSLAMRSAFLKCSPRAWGWSDGSAQACHEPQVFPTGVGMVRRTSAPGASLGGVPHGRGDGPAAPTVRCGSWTCSPRAWGWSAEVVHQLELLAVFPTGVGMVRPASRRPAAPPRVPHGRGDGPLYHDNYDGSTTCSPRAWGWSVRNPQTGRQQRVFPTGVGMVRPDVARPAPPRGVPHGRGDGPVSAQVNGQEVWCSPRAWGWSGRRGWRGSAIHVFPTGVGMVRRPWTRSATVAGVPHGRGDGPLCAGL